MTVAVWLQRAALLAGVLLLASCQQAMQPVAFHADSDPTDLAAWHVVAIDDGYLRLNEGVVPYTVNTKLFSDYAYKLRTVWMPKGSAATYNPDRQFEFPVGTIISKTFFYPLPTGAEGNGSEVARSYRELDAFVPGKGLDIRKLRLVETRLLVHRKDGWVGLPYVWNAAQTSARLSRIGDAMDLVLVDDDGKRTPFTYIVPNTNQCVICHDYTLDPTNDASRRVMIPIGPSARQLNADFTYASGSENQLAHWAEIGYLSGLPALDGVPRNANWMDAGQPLAERARSYLDANCSYCHNPHGQANYTSLWLTPDLPFGVHVGECKTPVAAGPATGGRLFDIVPGKPHASIMTYRMATAKVGEMMPELGRTTVDEKGVELIRAWIGSLEGSCTIIHQAPVAP